MATGADIARFWAKVDRPGPTACWRWTASVNVRRGGYGQFRMRPRTVRAHIFAYELVVGPVPVGRVLDHLCRNPGCVNPAHLDPVPHAENTRRGMSPSALSTRTNRCWRGHRFTPENTILRADRRECRTCENAAQRRRYADRKAA